MSRPLRLDGESDDAFRQRVGRMALIAKALVEGSLANRWMQEYIADPELPLYTEGRARRNPTVRIEYEQAIAIGGIGETLRVTASKHWGAGPQVFPLEPDDFFYPANITYIYRPESRYHRRFEQRRRMKELLGRRHRKLVGLAMQHTKKIFLQVLTEEDFLAIRRRLNVEPGVFWTAAIGRRFLELPPRWLQGELDFGDVS